MSWISNTAIDNSLGFQIMVIMEYVLESQSF